jgi:hypothetical protein
LNVNERDMKVLETYQSLKVINDPAAHHLPIKLKPRKSKKIIKTCKVASPITTTIRIPPCSKCGTILQIILSDIT